MFERRLKTFLIILLTVMSLLLARAFHLQVLTRGTWVKAAEDFKKRPMLVETTRGRILDHHGIEIAVDEACMDACVDYRAISRNEKWIRAIATRRLIDQLGDGYRKAPKDQRNELLAEEVKRVNDDISRTWVLLARESGQTLEQIEEICHAIDLKVAMRSRWVQYKRFQQADRAREESGPSPWYRRWLIEGGDNGPKVDDFEQEYGEQVEAHPIVKNVSTETYLRLAKEAERCPGLVLRPGTYRRYPYGRAGAHLIGQLTPVMKEDLENDPNVGSDELTAELRAYQFTDTIGRGGLEGLAEPALRGTRGQVLRQSGRDDEVLAAPVPGADVKSTIDIELQASIQQMFAHMRVPSNKSDGNRFEVAMHGAAVVIDVPTGQVRALASYPDYDANELSEKYAQLVEMTDDAPLMNRATQSMLEPGSTIKPVVGLGAITQGLVTHEHGIECTGYLVLNGVKYPNGRCWVATKFARLRNGDVAHHPIPIPHRGTNGNPNGFLAYAEALERSCNVYFETLADQLGLEGLSYWFERMGLGRETGLGIYEASGRLPLKLAERGYVPRSVVWFSGIGQAGVLTTPVQMANVAATIARDGVWMRPKLIETADVALNPFKPRDGREIPDVIDLKLSKAALSAAREGMIRVVNGEAGTGKAAHLDEILVAGKTGTAEAARIMDPVRLPDGSIQLDDKGRAVTRPRIPASADVITETPWYRGAGEDGTELNHAWFIGFAPARDPQVAFAVMIQYGGSGNFAGEVAKEILEKCVEHGHVKVSRRR